VSFDNGRELLQKIGELYRAIADESRFPFVDRGVVIGVDYRRGTEDELNGRC
jgi:hypothetical protein